MAPAYDLPASLVAAADAVAARFGAAVLERTEFRGDLTLSVAPEAWLEVLTFCRDNEATSFDMLDCLLGDHLPERTAAPFAVVAHLVSHTFGHRLQ